MVIDGVKITTNLPDLTREEAQRYVDYARVHVKDKLTDLDIRESSDGGVDLNWTAHGEKFERIRRVTGYLVGTWWVLSTAGMTLSRRKSANASST